MRDYVHSNIYFNVHDSEDRTESWSYERKKGGTATIYIEDGKVISIDESIDKKRSSFTGYSR